MPDIEPKALIDLIMRHALLSERGKAGVVNRAVEGLKELRRTLEREIALDAVNFALTLNVRLEGLLGTLAAIIDAEVESLWLALTDDVRRWLEIEAEFEVKALASRGFDAEIAVDDSSVAGWFALALATPALGRLPLEELSALRRTLFEQTRRVLRESAFEQRTLEPTLIDFRRMWRRREHEFDAFLRTFMASADAMLARDLAAKTGAKWWQSIGVLDNRISRICLLHHGRVYAVRAGAPWPPRHPRCRSRILLLASRRSPLTLPTAEQWLSSKTSVERERLLGTMRARLWKRGVTLNRLLSNAGEELTLDQLRARFRALFTAIENNQSISTTARGTA